MQRHPILAALSALTFLLLLTFVWQFLRQPQPSPVPRASETPLSAKKPLATSNSRLVFPLIDETALGMKTLQGYGTLGGIREDLQQIHALLQSYQTLVKAENALPFASNFDIAAALRGENIHRTAFLPEQHIAFNTQGELQDRWGTTLFFHIQSETQIEIRSAGPDRQMWTADDLQRNASGDYLTGESMTP